MNKLDWVDWMFLRIMGGLIIGTLITAQLLM